jgi:hypothetical protein
MNSSFGFLISLWFYLLFVCFMRVAFASLLVIGTQGGHLMALSIVGGEF